MTNHVKAKIGKVHQNSKSRLSDNRGETIKLMTRWLVGWLVGWLDLWPIKICRLFNTKFICIQIISSISNN